MYKIIGVNKPERATRQGRRLATLRRNRIPSEYEPPKKKEPYIVAIQLCEMLVAVTSNVN